MITPARVWEYAGYAFRQLKSGVPKPVHLDFPAEVARARFDDASELEYFFENTRYRTETKPHPDPAAIEAAAAMLASADRPMIVSSNGVFYSQAWGALRELAEKAHIPVVESGATKGQFPADHELSACAAPGALRGADVVLLVGQYCMPTLGEFAFGPEMRGRAGRGQALPRASLEEAPQLMAPGGASRTTARRLLTTAPFAAKLVD